MANLRAARVTVLYAAGGVGKSSLLRAGVAARLHAMAAREVKRGNAPPYVPVVFNAWHDDPVRDLIAAVEASVRRVAPDQKLELPRSGARRGR